MKRLRPEAHPTPIESRQGRTWEFTLYIAGQTPRSVAAVENLDSLCQRHLQGNFAVEIVDLLQHPEIARRDQIVAIPTLVRKAPGPIRRIIGDLSDTDRVLSTLRIGSTPR